MTILCYRALCETEQNFVFSWGVTPPVNCINNSSHTLDTNSITIVSQVSSQDTNVINDRKTVFSDIMTTSKNNIINLTSFLGMNHLRNNTSTQGSAIISNDFVEYSLQTTTNSTDLAVLSSKQNGRYIAGLSCEVGIAARIPSLPVGNQVMKWGYYDNDNGFYYKLTTNGLSVNVLRDGVENSIPQTEWSLDTMDGNGTSGDSLDTSTGNIYTITFSWYGFGSIIFGIVGRNERGNTTNISVHQYTPVQETSTTNPNLPITAGLENNGTSTSATMYIVGRQFSILGNYTPHFRTNHHHAQAVCSTSTLTPIISLRKKTDYLCCEAKLHRLFIDTDQTVLLECKFDNTLTNASFGNLLERECIMECDTSATAITGGTVVLSNIVKATDSGTVLNGDLQHIIFDNLTISAKSLTNTNANVLCSVTWREDW